MEQTHKIYRSMLNLFSKHGSKASAAGLLGLALLPSALQAAWSGPFNIYGFPDRWGTKSDSYFTNNGLYGNTKLLGQNSITKDGDPTSLDEAKVKYFLTKMYPDSTSTGYMVLDWEAGPFHDLRIYAKGTAQFNAARDKLNRLLSVAKSTRPNVKFTIYGIPYRGYSSTQITSYNPSGKYTEVLRNMDFISPTYYILKADEATGHARNIQYLSENMNVALAYKKALGKPVIPHVWHRIHDRTGDEYKHQIIQKEVFAKYIKHIYQYSYDGQKTSGVIWWDWGSSTSRYKDLAGINNHLGDLISGASNIPAAYDSHMVTMTSAIKSALDSVSAPATTQQVTSFTLVNASTGQDIQTLSSGATLNLATLPTQNLNIRANTDPGTVGSVKMYLSGTQTRTQTESGAPYALFGGNPYASWTPAVGSYTLKAIPYTASSGGGTAGTALTVSFSVVNQSGPSVTSFTVVDLSTGKAVNTISNGEVLYRSNMPSKIEIRANTGGTVGSVKMVLSGSLSRTQLENLAPYDLFGGQLSNAWAPAVGSYTLKGTAYSASSGSGTAGTTYSISFTVK